MSFNRWHQNGRDQAAAAAQNKQQTHNKQMIKPKKKIKTK